MLCYAALRGRVLSAVRAGACVPSAVRVRLCGSQSRCLDASEKCEVMYYTPVTAPSCYSAKASQIVSHPTTVVRFSIRNCCCKCQTLENRMSTLNIAAEKSKRRNHLRGGGAPLLYANNTLSDYQTRSSLRNTQTGRWDNDRFVSNHGHGSAFTSHPDHRPRPSRPAAIITFHSSLCRPFFISATTSLPAAFI